MDSALDADIQELLGSGSPDSAPLSGLDDAPGHPEPSAARQPSMDRISEADLADLIGVSTRRIRALASEGVIMRVGRGAAAFDRRDAVRAYCASMRDKASRGVAVMDELKTEKIRQAREAADKLALQNAAARRELVPATEVQATWSGILRDVRASLLAVPSRCGAKLPHLTPHDVSEIDAELKAALEGLADGG
jgi:phage terminase Nu1 subunit (DNA packaging protein)